MPRLGSGIPLVARAEEMRRLSAAFEGAELGEANAVLLSGDAGVGKTRLLTELGARASAAGALVLTGRSLDVREGGLPYLPFAEALAPLATSEDPVVAEAVRARPALGRLLPQGEPMPGGGLPEHMAVTTATEQDPNRRRRAEQDLGQLQLFDAVLGVLAEVGERRPIVLVVEDLHWADGATRNLLSFLVSRLRAQRLLVIGSYREEDVHRRHPLRALLGELVRLPTVTTVDLRPFQTADAKAFIEALVDGPLDADVLARVVERSEGNPFFAEELVASCVTCEDIPAGLAELLLSRLERLPVETRRVLRAISVASEPVSHAALADVSGLGEFELDEALREAVQHHVVVVEKGCYLFRHALLQEAVYGDLLPGERIRMHAAYAARFRAMPPARGHAAKFAYHSLESKDFSAALPALLEAAEEAEKLGAPGTALRHVEQALEIWHAVPAETRPAEVDELKLLGEASHFAGTSGEPERAVAYARSATQALTPEIEPERAAKIWRRRSEALLALESGLEESVEAIGKAWELVEHAAPSPARAWVLATRANILRITRRRDEALWSAQTAVEDARATGARGGEALALIMLSLLAENSGNVEEARDKLREAKRKARAAGSLSVELKALYYLALSYDDHGEIPQAIEGYQAGIRRAEEASLNWSEFGLEVRARHLALRYISGDWPTKAGAGQPGRGVSGAVAARMAASWVQIVVGRGQVETAERLISNLRAQWRVDTLIALAAGSAATELAFWHRDHASAVAYAQEAIGWLDQLGPWLLGGIRIAALGLSAAVEQAAAARLRGDGTTVAAAVAAGEALLAHARSCAEHGRPRTGKLGPEGQAWLARAEAEARSLGGTGDPSCWAGVVEAFGYGAIYEQAITRWRRAKVLLAAGEEENTALAERELVAAHEVADRIGAVSLRDAVREVARRARLSLPGVDASVLTPRDVLDPLTSRERSVLEQVALGRTNRQVGEELYISEKTVSVHVSRVLAKLKVSNRAEAVAVAYERGLLTKPASV